MSTKPVDATRPDYARSYETFRLDQASARLSGDLDAAINACVECCDRYVGEGRVALRCLSADETLTTHTFEDLQALSARAARVFRAEGVGPGDVVAGLLPRTVDLVATILGAWRIGAVYQPLFTAFGPKAIEHRLGFSGAKLVVTNPANRDKLDDVANAPRAAVVAQPGTARDGDLDLRAAMGAAGTDLEPVMRRGDDLFMLMSTSGTTGLAKGVPVPLGALNAFSAYMRLAVDLRDDDTFWKIADPGWAYGLYYAITGPLMLGQATLLYEGGFTADSTYRIIRRMAVLDDQGRELGPDEPGILAVDIARSPLMWFGGYLNLETPAIAGGYYRTGDTVEWESDGSISFIGRSDDIITSSGYRIGPFDVESALIEHPAVVETAVIGVPDPERTEIVKAFVVLAGGVDASPALADELALHVKRRLSAHAYPRAIEFVEQLPKTPSGKIQRFVLRKAEIEKSNPA